MYFGQNVLSRTINGRGIIFLLSPLKILCLRLIKRKLKPFMPKMFYFYIRYIAPDGIKLQEQNYNENCEVGRIVKNSFLRYL